MEAPSESWKIPGDLGWVKATRSLVPKKEACNEEKKYLGWVCARQRDGKQLVHHAASLFSTCTSCKYK